MQGLRLEQDKCYHSSFCHDNYYIGSKIVLYFCCESGTTVLTGLMLILCIDEAMSFITATFQLAVEQKLQRVDQDPLVLEGERR